MSRIGLIDVDGHNFPNLALMKLSSWHKAQGDDVEWAIPFNHYDTIYRSKIFTFSPDDLTYYSANQVIRGAVGVIVNNRDRAFYIGRGQRIAQMTIYKVEDTRLVEVDELSETDRGEGGFGSSGN